MAYRDRLELAMGIPFVEGNKVNVLNNGRAIFPAMLEAIATAERTIDFETFVYWQGDIAVRFAGALTDRSRAGVRVRVLLDSYGARKIPTELVDGFEAANVEVRWFRPLATWRLWRTDKRTHRKLLICDDQVGFTGGVGIAEEWEGDARGPEEWRDIHACFDGPAVGGLRAAFVENWNEAGPWVWDDSVSRPRAYSEGVPVQVVRASATVGWTDIATLLRSLISLARREVRLVTAYFAPDPRLVDLLVEAVRRGVFVSILVPGRHCDSRLSQLAGLHAVEQLLAAGVEVYRYDHTMLHSKCITVDGRLACIGSANINYRSLGKDEECCAIVLDERITSELNATLDEDCRRATALVASQLQTRGFGTRLGEWFARRIIEEL